jgi:hypothetical protein
MDPARTAVATERERRRERRRRSSAEHGVLAARIRPGHVAVLLDISTYGAQLETGRRLLPGSTVDLLLALPVGDLIVRGVVLRCSVTRVEAADVRYRGAVAFDRRIWWSRTLEYVVPRSELASGR